MSPHAINVHTETPSGTVDLSEFSVTKNAFLPEKSPLPVLSDPYYEAWELVAQHLPELIDQGRIHRAVKGLPLLSTDRLKSEAEWRRAYTMLGFISQAYIWGGDKPEEILPPQITVPFLQVSEHVELPPVLTYAGASLWNFTCQGEDFSDLDKLKLCFSFTGTESESWFFLISVAMEAQAAGILQTMIRALDGVKTRDYEGVIHGLEKLKQCIDNVAALLERMYERCDPMVFYHRIRPFVAGSKNMASAGLPNGVFYDEGDGNGEWRQYRGGSNGQSSIIQFFDVVLGVDHDGHGGTNHSSYHSEIREYMPGPHRRFLVHAERLGSIRKLAMVPPVTEAQRRLQGAYTAVTTSLSRFRQKHIAIVTKYIILPSKKPWHGTRLNLASSSSQSNGEENLTGTGGTMLMPFLKQARDETTEAAKLGKDKP